MTDALDRPIWHCLNGRGARFAMGEGKALRFDPEVEPFAATEDDGPGAMADLASLMAGGEEMFFMQIGPAALPEGAEVTMQLPGVQMMADTFEPSDPPDGIIALSDADAPEMVALATRCRPGPFLKRTNQLGGFFGVRDDKGTLVAMAGERLKLEGMTELSGVCTAEGARGQGLAEKLCRHVASQIMRRGETPILHTFASNEGAIRLYRRLGFKLREGIVMTGARMRRVDGNTR